MTQNWYTIRKYMSPVVACVTKRVYRRTLAIGLIMTEIETGVVNVIALAKILE
jgi:hypothetical protein